MSMLHRHRWVACAVAGRGDSGWLGLGRQRRRGSWPCGDPRHPSRLGGQPSGRDRPRPSPAARSTCASTWPDRIRPAWRRTPPRCRTRRSASYGDYLTPAQAQARFGATSAQIQAVESWLTGAGLTVTGVTSGAGGYVSVTGTVAQASQAFGVSFANYTDPTGQTARAPQSAATVPSSVSGDVLAVSGLDTGPRLDEAGRHTAAAAPNYWVAPPTSTYYGSKIATNEPTANGRPLAVERQRATRRSRSVAPTTCRPRA